MQDDWRRIVKQLYAEASLDAVCVDKKQKKRGHVDAEWVDGSIVIIIL